MNFIFSRHTYITVALVGRMKLERTVAILSAFLFSRVLSIWQCSCHLRVLFLHIIFAKAVKLSMSEPLISIVVYEWAVIDVSSFMARLQ